ncbi:carbohydrate porin [Cyanobacterium stanieri LEGE 03274]|uniref:Carbohydrate porin n=1 Tax=Cyanobacterium stanieri LEGE 03274 TaxID=1828756 RepID=A0ABR9V1L8_9CHRO|nr:iron uptake porin [Cyanobacterium stanieri]MBE9221787.1 carbohydrate porin [Cyanobacterium stanieri LEGE 03274]
MSKKLNKLSLKTISAIALKSSLKSTKYQLIAALSILVATNPAHAETNFIDIDNQNSMGQVTSVNQLSDVSPTDWAYEALRSLVERYGCIVGYPDRTFRGNRALSRYEFAAGLNACMQSIERLIGTGGVSEEDIAALRRLIAEFETELAALGARVDNLEGRVAFLEDNQFSTTTKLAGEVAFTLADAFGGDVTNPTTGLREDFSAQTTFTSRVRLQMSTSFTGNDVLYTRLTAGNLENSFASQTFTNEGRFAYDGQAGNNLTLDRLHYYFSPTRNLRVFTMASLGGHHFYADTFNSGLEAGGGAGGALSRFGERNPIYRLGLGGQGLGLRTQLGDKFELSAGYLARGGNNPAEGRGLLNGNYSAMGQLVFKPSNRFKLGLTYINSYDPNGAGSAFNFGGTGTRFGNLQGLGLDGIPVASNSYGVQGQFDISPKFSLRAWGGYTNARLIETGSAEIWNYAVALAFPDLGKEGSLGAIIVGAEPYLTGLSVPNAVDFAKDTPLHVEVSYKYPINDRISLTPGLIVLTAPNQNSGANDPIYIGTLRTTFSF